jgi:hypothetical protein
MDADLLFTIAEIAVAFAGFSGIAVVLRRSATGHLPPHARRTLWYLVIDCLAVLFLAFLPAVLQQYGWAAQSIWTASNAVLGATHLVLLSPALWWFSRGFEQIRAEWQPVVSPLQASLIGWSALIGVVQLLAALGVGAAAGPGLYTVSLLALLFFAAVDFVFLVAGEDD